MDMPGCIANSPGRLVKGVVDRITWAYLVGELAG